MKELLDIIGQNPTADTIEIPMTLAVEIAEELNRLRKIREALET